MGLVGCLVASHRWRSQGIGCQPSLVRLHGTSVGLIRVGSLVSRVVTPDMAVVVPMSVVAALVAVVGRRVVVLVVGLVLRVLTRVGGPSRGPRQVPLQVERVQQAE